jgi:hypothetical protein
MKTAQTNSYANINSIAAATGGIANALSNGGAEAQNYSAEVYNTKFDDTVGSGVLDTKDLDAGYQDSAYMSLGNGKKEWASFKGRVSSEAENFARVNASEGQIFFY